MSELLTGFDDRQVYAVVKRLKFKTVLKGIVPLFLVDILKHSVGLVELKKPARQKYSLICHPLSI